MRRRRSDAHIDDELRFHIEKQIESNIAAGLSPDEARRQAMLEFGSVEASTESCRELRLTHRLELLLQDVRYALRVLGKQPRFTIVTLLMMTLSVGATTCLFSAAYGVLASPLPWRDADRLVVLRETRGGNPPRFGSFTNVAFSVLHDSSTLVSAAAWSLNRFTITSLAEPQHMVVAQVSGDYFATLQIDPLLGSTFGEKDTSSHVVVLTDSLWREAFADDPHIVGRPVLLEDEPYTVVGVVSARQALPANAVAFVPYRVAPVEANSISMFNAVARLKPGANAKQAAAELTAKASNLPDGGLTATAIFGKTARIEITPEPMLQALVADVRRPLLFLLAAVLVLFFAATANLASMQLARSLARAKEVATRAALGASRSRIVQQLVVESVVIAMAGGAAGIGLAATLQLGLSKLLPADFPRASAIGMNGVAVLFALGISLLAAVIFGLLPAVESARIDLRDALAQESGPAEPRRTRRVGSARTWLIAGQVTAACMLLICGTLLCRSFLDMLHADRGYDPSGVTIAQLVAPQRQYTPERRSQLMSAVLERLAHSPGVRGAAFTSEMPTTPGGSTMSFHIERTGAAPVDMQASPRIVSPDYFSTLRVRVLSGRVFSEIDTEASIPVVVVNRAFAQRYLGNAPLDATLPGSPYTPTQTASHVIGVVDDTRYIGNVREEQPEIFYSYRQIPKGLLLPMVTLLLRADASAGSPAALLREAVRASDSHLIPDNISLLSDRLLVGLARPRLYAVLLAAFAALAVVIAGVGIFGLLSFAVAQRSRELAIRSALGAQRGQIVSLVLRSGVKIAAGGIVLGLLASAAATRLLKSMLYGVGASDLATYLFAAGFVLLVAVLACLQPAWRAARLEPAQLLRS